MMANLVNEILNSEYKDRVLGIVKLNKDKSNEEKIEQIIVYSSVIKEGVEYVIESHKKEIEEYDHYVIFLSDFDLENIEDKIKLKADFYEKFLNYIKKNNLNIWLNILLIEDFKQMSMDSRFDLFDFIASGEVLYDKGFIDILRLTTTHRNLIINDLQKYVVAYVLAGSQVKGRSVESSDVDVYAVIDDTDVKRYTFEELKASLTRLIVTRALEAQRITNSKKILHPQVYTLTEFWYEISELNPVIITFLRDGIALYDRGLFIAWKQLLLKGILKPSKESSDKYMNQAESLIKDAKDRIQSLLNILVTENLAVSMISAGQSVLMSYGLLPPDPKETIGLLRKIFVEERKNLEEKYVKDLEEVWNIRKKFERGEIEKISYEDYTKYLEEAEEFINRMKALKQMIDKEREYENIKYYIDLYNSDKKIIEELFGKNVREIFSNDQYVSDLINRIENNINLYLQNKRDIIEVEKMIEDIKRIDRIFNKLIFEKREEILSNYFYHIIDENGKVYGMYMTNDKIYLMLDKIYVYNYNGEKIGELNLEAYKDILNEMVKNGKREIDSNLINALSKIFKNFKIEK